MVEFGEVCVLVLIIMLVSVGFMNRLSWCIFIMVLLVCCNCCGVIIDGSSVELVG